MPSIPVWFTTSQGPFTVVLTPQVNTAGSLADDISGAVNIHAELDDIEVNVGIEGEDIRSLTQIQRNMVRSGEGTTITLVEILKYTGTNISAAQSQGFQFFKVVITRGAQVWTGYARKYGYTEGLKNGKSVGRLTLEPCGLAVGYA